MIKVCYEGGVRFLEFINCGDFVYEIFVGLSKFCVKEFFEMILGVGLINDVGMVSLYI